MSNQEQQTKPDGGASVSTDMLERMATDAGLWQERLSVHMAIGGLAELKRFADLVAAVEREACAKTCEDLWQEEATAAANGNQNPKYHDCIECAYAIRERSNEVVQGRDAGFSAARPSGTEGSAT